MIELVRYHTWHKGRDGYESAKRVALVRHGGRKWLHVVTLDATAQGGLRVHKVPKTDTKYMLPLLNRFGKPYNMNRALATFRKLAKSHGCTKGAMKIIKEAASEKAKQNDSGESTAASA